MTLSEIWGDAPDDKRIPPPEDVEELPLRKIVLPLIKGEEPVQRIPYQPLSQIVLAVIAPGSGPDDSIDMPGPPFRAMKLSAMLDVFDRSEIPVVVLSVMLFPLIVYNPSIIRIPTSCPETLLLVMVAVVISSNLMPTPQCTSIPEIELPSI